MKHEFMVTFKSIGIIGSDWRGYVPWGALFFLDEKIIYWEQAQGYRQAGGEVPGR